ncbi:MarR family transcriptional regulator [Amycolatopsis sp. NPDC051371]|jgi:MarR family transcriptional regulator for hemolysin|uniref:MarR family winged helix-turn-helix transcriptional regulator n=1 Tax=Amycolatopsis sp. NPDC051371 TaxID=3155800 RepID=UPI00341785DE
MAGLVKASRRSPSGLGSLGYRLSLVSRLARAEFERRLTDAGASFATWTILETLGVRGPMIQRDLAESLNLSGQTLTRHVDRLVTSGWLRRVGMAEDRRAALLEVTAEGNDLYERLAVAARAANARLARGLSKQERATLDDLLSRVAANVGGQ